MRVWHRTPGGLLLRAGGWHNCCLGGSVHRALDMSLPCEAHTAAAALAGSSTAALCSSPSAPRACRTCTKCTNTYFYLSRRNTCEACLQVRAARAGGCCGWAAVWGKALAGQLCSGWCAG